MRCVLGVVDDQVKGVLIMAFDVRHCNVLMQAGVVSGTMTVTRMLSFRLRAGPYKTQSVVEFEARCAGRNC